MRAQDDAGDAPILSPLPDMTLLACDEGKCHGEQQAGGPAGRGHGYSVQGLAKKLFGMAGLCVSMHRRFVNRGGRLGLFSGTGNAAHKRVGAGALPLQACICMFLVANNRHMNECLRDDADTGSSGFLAAGGS